MKHFLFSGNESPEEVQRILIDHAEGSESMQIQRLLTEDELIELREEFVNNNLDIKRENEVLANAKKVHKDAIKPMVTSNKEILSTLNSKHKEVNEKVYRLPNFETGFMEYVNLSGEVVFTRRLKPEEKQGRVFPMAKAVNE